MADRLAVRFGALRAAGPVLKADKGPYLATSREAAEFVLKNPGLFSSRLSFATDGQPVRLVPGSFSPPAHTRYRQVLRPFFSPRAVAAYQPALRTLVNKLIDSFASRAGCEFAAELAVPLPVDVLLVFLGLPLADRDRVIGWKDGVKTAPARLPLRRPAGQHEAGPPDGQQGGAPGRAGTCPADGVRAASTGLSEYLTGHIAGRRRHASDDDGLLSRLIADPRVDFTDDELLGLSLQVVIAGLDTVTSVLTTAFAILAESPGLRAMLARRPATAAAAAEEFLRVAGVNPVIPRYAARQVELAGQAIPAGSAVHVALGAAGRDPAVHHDADVVDFSRREAHIAFGAGPHRCLGLHLARAELETVLAEWHRRIPDYGLAPGERPWTGRPGDLFETDELRLAFHAGPGTADA
jgi:cytochrome P450